MRSVHACVTVLFLCAACSSDEVTAPEIITQWIVDDLSVPTSASEATALGIDLDGDAAVDNQLGNVLAVLKSAGIDAQVATNAAVAGGEIVQLIEFAARDATLANDAAAHATWYVGMPNGGNPTATQEVDDSYAAGTVVGSLAARDYSSTNPVTTTQPVEVYIPLRLFADAATIYLPMNGAHLQWSFSGTTGIMSGEIHGSIRKDDIDNLLIPSMTDVFNTIVQLDPTSSDAESLLDLFDTGGCDSAVADDGAIQVCEVATNSLMETLLAPDAAIYDAAGNYDPGSAAPNGGAFSLGLGFTAVPATF